MATMGRQEWAAMEKAQSRHGEIVGGGAGNTGINQLRLVKNVCVPFVNDRIDF